MKTGTLKTGLFACFAAGALFSASASADLVINPNPDGTFNTSYFFEGKNDCAGAAGDSFKECSINGSPIIGKFGIDDDNTLGEIELNKDVWKSITGAEFSVVYNAMTKMWDWTYTPTAPDPLIKWVVAKTGDGFTAFYLPGATSGMISPDKLSHISFYDTANPVPLPAAAWLLGSGLLGLFAVGRRRKGAAAAAA
jgi:hypothetical protein